VICDSLSGTGRSAGFVPAVELLGQRQEQAAIALLTHPHDDHVAGFDRLVNRPAVVEVLHPDAAYLSRGQPDPVKAPNDYSTPVLVQWGATRIVLGAGRGVSTPLGDRG
jgi:glyoxylase-like metal-dependent hydrolase (beta-lactamase superfamily II)